MATFAGDVRRLPKEAQVSYAVALEHTLDHLVGMIRAQQPTLSKLAARAKAIALYSQMVGSLLLSRAVATGDPELSGKILEHTRADLLSVFPDRAREKRIGNS